ncbi:cystathionine gamma-synthase [Streptomyces antnestii]|uniref:Cystathionine gamma-synthase n=1 Tax=Streptomyces antnestii TaxID=2494256 RepID=A0A3S2VCB3_9ACTN|nr:cystathionine gamma-synthase [Streptomyces sp. San01]RVU19629.1 cystathionine gamma-synthase [Streptomyces sp. San01]
MSDTHNSQSAHAGHGFETVAIHAGNTADPLTGAVVPPIYQVSTYKQDGVGGLRGGYEYSRSANPTRTALEENLAALEGGRRGLAFASGLAAEDCLLRTLLTPGDHVVIPNDAYGGTFRLFAKVVSRWGVEWSVADTSDPASVRAALTPKTKVIWVETPSNPLLGITDIAAVAQIAREAGARLVVDNTFASPYLQQPLALGADVVVHSLTKYMGGHSDVVGGALIVNDADLGDELAYHQNAMGAVAGPMDAWLVLRGIKTLPVRMDRHSENATKVADMLTRHARVTRVLYPGLAEHPGHEVAAKQMRAFGGMVSFQVEGGEEAAVEVCNRAKLFTLGESLGGVESLIEHPGRMTHASVAGSALEVPADLVRLSVGIESADDLIADLQQALG